MDQKHTFTSAYARLKEIHSLLATKEMLDIENVISLQKEAKELHDFLLDRLHTVTKEIDATPLSGK